MAGDLQVADRQAGGRKMKARCWVGLLVIILVVLTFLYIWPGVCRYSYYKNGLTRVDKLTGQFQAWDYISEHPHWRTVGGKGD